MSSTSAAAAAAAAKARNKKKKAKGKKAATTSSLAPAADQQGTRRGGAGGGGVLLGTDDLDDDDEDEYDGELALDNHAGHLTAAQQQQLAAAVAGQQGHPAGGHQQQQQPPSSTLAHPAATPSDLLSTASDLYRQIEAAAASALSSHPSFAASFPPPNASSTGQQQSAQQQQQGGTTGGNNSNAASSADEAYWTSLPQHLRQFIRSALPLAAGWTSGPNGQPVPAATPGTTSTTIPLAGLVSGLAGATSTTTSSGSGGALPPLTHEQLSSAAAQLAQMVQSNWGQFGLGPAPPNGTVPRSATLQQQQQQQGGAQATISLGSFPVGMPTREQMEEAIGSIGGQFAGGEFTMTMGPTGAFPAPPPPPPAPPAAAAANAEPVIDDTEDEDAGANEGGTSASAAAKKKNKKKKKKERERAAAAAAAAATAAAAAQQKEAAEAEAFRQRALDVANAEAYAAAAVAARVPAPPGAYPSSAGAPQQQQQPPQTTVNGGTAQANASSGSNHHAAQQNNHQQHPNNTNANAKAGPSSEREQIRDFWLGLKEQDRRALVKVEKEAVLKKMKQAMSGSQGGACSCGVCGRKRCAFLLPIRRHDSRENDTRADPSRAMVKQIRDRVRVVFAVRRVLRRTRVVCFASATLRFSPARHDPAATRSRSLPRLGRPVHIAGNTSGRFCRRRWRCRCRSGRETATRSSRQADSGSQECPTGRVVVASQEEASYFRRRRCPAWAYARSYACSWSSGHHPQQSESRRAGPHALDQLSASPAAGDRDRRSQCGRRCCRVEAEEQGCGRASGRARRG